MAQLWLSVRLSSCSQGTSSLELEFSVDEEFGFLVARVRKETGGFALFDHASSVEVDYMLGKSPRLSEVVGAKQDGSRSSRVFDRSLDDHCVGGIEVCCGFVDQEN